MKQKKLTRCDIMNAKYVIVSGKQYLTGYNALVPIWCWVKKQGLSQFSLIGYICI